MKNFEQLNLSSKRVILRVDFNVPLQNNEISDFARINALKDTIALLKEKGAKIVIISHFGRPNGEVDPHFSLKFLVPHLAKIFASTVTFEDDILSALAIAKSHALRNGEILLLENIRFHIGEESNNIAFAKKLAAFGDIFINDAFSCSHRTHASIVGIPQYLPSYPGLSLKNEIQNLSSIMQSKSNAKIAIIGGKKVATKFKILNFLDNIISSIVITGAMANTFLKAQGYEMGNSYYEEDFVEQAAKFLQSCKSKLILPTDVVAANRVSGEFVNLKVQSLPDLKKPHNMTILDVGPMTTIEIYNAISISSHLLWNGPLGMFEDIRFRAASDAIARIASLKTSQGALISVAGGGDTMALLESNGLKDNFTFISTAGGAFLEWLETGTLPGLDVLMKD